MTERQGGSDVRANETRAEPSGDVYLLDGDKWFCSAPMSDAFLVLAQAPDGLTCFLLPRILDDGSRNGFRIDRLKDKLGNRSNASAEIRLEDAVAHRVGDEGRGVATIIEMVVHTRLDCVLGSTALMRRAVAEATHHAAHRAAFGRLLSEQPLMQNVLADLCLDSEAATATAMRLARAFDEGDHAFRRLATAVAKYWVCKATPPLVAEALECLGGNGYVEESSLPRLYRESPVNSVWEGSGNVNCLDVLRALAREPESREAFRAELELAHGADHHLDAALSGARPGARRGRREQAPPARRASGARAPGLAPRPARARRGRGRILRDAARRRGRSRVRDAARRAWTPPRSSSATDRARVASRSVKRRDLLLPGLKRLRPAGRESRGRVEPGAGHEAVALEGAKSQYDVVADGSLVFSKQQRGPLPGGGRGARAARGERALII